MLYLYCHHLPIELPTVSRNVPQFPPDVSFLNLFSCFISLSVLGVEQGLTAEASTPSHTQSLSYLIFLVSFSKDSLLIIYQSLLIVSKD